MSWKMLAKDYRRKQKHQFDQPIRLRNDGINNYTRDFMPIACVINGEPWEAALEAERSGRNEITSFKPPYRSRYFLLQPLWIYEGKSEAD